jgi:hypothetical protein
VPSAKACQDVQGCDNACQGLSRQQKGGKQVKLQGNEHIIGLISHQFTFSMRGMLGTPTLGANRCQVPSVNAF